MQDTLINLPVRFFNYFFKFESNLVQAEIDFSNAIHVVVIRVLFIIAGYFISFLRVLRQSRSPYYDIDSL